MNYIHLEENLHLQNQCILFDIIDVRFFLLFIYKIKGSTYQGKIVENLLSYKLPNVKSEKKYWDNCLRKQRVQLKRELNERVTLNGKASKS